MTMPASEKFYDRLKARLRDETDRNVQDKLLDLWLETEKLATEWDGEQWGFNPDKWMEQERDILAVRAHQDKKSRSDRQSPE